MTAWNDSFCFVNKELAFPNFDGDMSTREVAYVVHFNQTTPRDTVLLLYINHIEITWQRSVAHF